MRIKWYGTASLLLEGGGTRILVDPYLKRYNPSLPRVPVEEAGAADAAVITHPHVDHFADIGAFLQAGLRCVYVSENGISHAEENGIPTDAMNPIEKNDNFAVGGITVRTYYTRHCSFDAATVCSVLFSPRTWLHFGKGVRVLREAVKFPLRDDTLALEFSHEGKRVFVLGSAALDEDTEYPQGADLLVLPYQGRACMSRYIQPILRTLAPKRVMIDHFDDAFPPISHAVNTKKFLPAVEKNFPGMQAFIPVENEWYEI